MTAITEEIWGAFRTRLYAYIRARSRSADDAEDILQEVFVKIHCRLGTLHDEARLTSWLYRVTHNTIVDYYRKRRDVPVSDPPLPAFDDDDGPTPEELLAPFLGELVDALPPHYRDALTLTEFDGLTQEEMGNRLGLSTSGAKSRVQRGRTMLRDKLLDCCDVELDGSSRIIEFSYRKPDPPPRECPCDPNNG